MGRLGMRRLTGLILFLGSAWCWAATLPGSLSASDINRVVEILGPGSAIKLLRSSEAYDPWPGIKIGAEVAFDPAEEIDQLGDHTGSVPGLNPEPRLFLSKGLFSNLELSLMYWPSGWIDTVSAFGAALKYAFDSEREHWLSGAVYGAFTRIHAFGDDYTGADEELGIEISKDFVRLKPYLGAGILLAQGYVNQSLAANPAQTSGSTIMFHSFLGFEIEMPVNLTFQVDLMNLQLGGSFFIGVKF